MKFIDPMDAPDIPTYRVIDSDGALVDKARGAPKVSDETVLTWYKNMLTGRLNLRIQQDRTDKVAVSIMDVIMFEAQRQGRLSFYMVLLMLRFLPRTPI